MHRPALMALLATVGLLGCGGPGLSVKGESVPGLVARDRALLDEVVKLRHLRLRRDVLVRYRRQEQAGGASPGGSGPSRDTIGRVAVWVAFGMVSPDYQPAEVLTAVGRVRRQLAGSYNDRDRIIDLLVDSKDEQRDETVFHEMVHALTDQHFALERLRGIDADDEALAARAVAEGDASFASQLWKGLRSGATVEATSARILERADQRDREAGPRGLPPMLRELVSFPYRAGTRFIAALHAVGSFALVDRIYTRLPVSTEQVLHPQKYADGEPPIDLPTPITPLGWHRVAAGTLGELGIRTLLERCLPTEAAHAAAAGWGGDRYLVVDKPGVRPRLLWSTAWDDELAAARFESALERYSTPRCQYSRLPEWVGAPMAPFTWRRQGTRIVVERGFDLEAAREALAGMLAVPTTTPVKRPPFGALVLRDAPAKPAPRRTYRVGSGRFASDALGLTGEVPEGFSGTLDLASGQLTLSGPATMMLSTMPMPLSPEFVDKLEREGRERFSGAFIERVPVELTLGSGMSLRVRIDRGERPPGHALMVLLPTCAGKRTLLTLALFQDGRVEELVRGFTASLRALDHPGSACTADLD